MRMKTVTPSFPPEHILGRGSKTCVDVMGIGASQCVSRGWRIPAHAGQYSYEWLHQERREQLNTHFLTIRDLQGQLSNGERCVKAEGGDRVTIAWCEMGVVKGPWSYDASSRQIVNSDHKKCLAVHPDTRALTLMSCDAHNLYRKWGWSEITREDKILD